MSKKQKTSKISPKAQRIIDIVVTSVEALVVIVCVLVSVLAWVGAGNKPESRKVNWFAIQTASMVGDNPDSLNPGDVMIARQVAKEDIHVGDVIAFRRVIRQDGKDYNEIVSHRVVAINEDGTFQTKGDNVRVGLDLESVKYSDVLGKYSGKLKGVGKVILWLQGYKKVNTVLGPGYEATGKSTQFLVIIIPLALLFLYNGYVVVKYVLDERAKKIREAAMAEAADAAVDQEAIKRAALEDFMRSQGLSEDQIAAYFAQSAPKAQPDDAATAPADSNDSDAQ